MPRLHCALGPDNAGDLLRDFIRAETEWLDVAVYEAGPGYGWMFVEQARQGTRLRLLLDGHGGDNRGCLEEVRHAAEGGITVPCRMVMRHAGVDAHWKMLAAAPARAAVGTGNLVIRDAPYRHGDTRSGMAGTREWWLLVDGAPTLTAAIRRAISAAWRSASPPPRLWTVDQPSVVPPVNAPTPRVAPLEVELTSRRLHLAVSAHQVAGMLEAVLSTASRRVLLTVPYVHAWAHPVRPLVARLAELCDAGLDVRVLLGSPPSDGDAAALLERSLPVRVMNPVRCTTGHAKGMVAGASVVVTSANWSETGLGSALECALRVDHPDAADYYAAAFDRDWNLADQVTLPQA